MIRNDALTVALDAGQNPYLMGPYAPVDAEIDASGLVVVGEIPSHLEGLSVRNGPNPRFPTKGRYHWFDGDSMLHAMHFENGHNRLEGVMCRSLNASGRAMRHRIQRISG